VAVGRQGRREHHHNVGVFAAVRPQARGKHAHAPQPLDGPIKQRDVGSPFVRGNAEPSLLPFAAVGFVT